MAPFSRIKHQRLKIHLTAYFERDMKCYSKPKAKVIGKLQKILFPSCYKFFHKRRNAVFTPFGHGSKLISTATYWSLALSCARKEENSKETHFGNYVRS